MKRPQLRRSAAVNPARCDTAPEAACASGLFDSSEPEIMRLTTAIGQAAGLTDKAKLAVEMAASTQVLLDCAQHAAGNVNCTLCRKLASLRHETAALVLKMAARGRVGV